MNNRYQLSDNPSLKESVEAFQELGVHVAHLLENGLGEMTPEEVMALPGFVLEYLISLGHLMGVQQTMRLLGLSKSALHDATRSNQNPLKVVILGGERYFTKGWIDERNRTKRAGRPRTRSR